VNAVAIANASTSLVLTSQAQGIQAFKFQLEEASDARSDFMVVLDTKGRTVIGMFYTI
jgi:hypothetical protein|tara:strand:+ start:318 stop:491 length:174 start_codon:yes stop_codon:yes gene_type:complete